MQNNNMTTLNNNNNTTSSRRLLCSYSIVTAHKDRTILFYLYFYLK